MSDGLVKPIIVVGAARSGTSLLVSSLARHPDLAWIDEPNFIWKAYNADVGHDMLPASRATPRVKAYIRERFEEFRRRAGAARIVEKTPQTGLRLPFVLEVFPDARLVHVIRDGRQVVASARRKYGGSVAKVTTRGEDAPSRAPDRGSFRNLPLVVASVRQKTSQRFPLRDAPWYGPKLWNMGLGMLGLKRTFSWGPEFPGMRRMLRTHSVVDVCALQWQLCVETALNTLASRPDVPCYEVRFERLVREPEKVTREVFAFAELADPGELRPLRRVPFDPGLDSFRRDLSPEEQRVVADRIAATLNRLGYRDA